jgi:predicted amidohydrolase YtcJ
MLFRDADVAGTGRTDVRTAGAAITGVGQRLSAAGDAVVDCDGGALLPGLHDHHCHVLAAAAALDSVPCGPPAVRDAGTLAARLATAVPRHGWVRGIGYDEAIAGHLDASALDELSPPGVAVRIQHRSGALWIVNSAGAAALGLYGACPDSDAPAGIERDAAGRLTGRLWRMDGWLRDRLSSATGAEHGGPDVAALARRLADRGVTGVTDATVGLAAAAVRAIVSGGFGLRLVSLGEPHDIPGVGLGPRKIVVADHDLPAPAALAAVVRESRPRAVAIHCVTRVALILTLSALAEAGTIPGDRIEHAAVVPPDVTAWLVRLGVTVVTQPSMVALRGDEYLARVDADDQACLWPFGSLLEAGVPVGCSSDAPYGDADPWASIAAAVGRRTPSGHVVAAGEAVSAWEALRGYLTRPDDPGGPERKVAVGEPADLVLLDRPLADALARPGEVTARATFPS